MAFKDKNLSFADLSVTSRLDRVKSFLKEIDNIIDFEKLRPILNKNGKGVKNACGKKAYDSVIMFKILLLQKYYDLSDQACSDALYVNLLYIRFVGLSLDNEVPDESTIGRFRNSLIDNNLYDQLFDSINRQLENQGYIAKEGKTVLVDATLIKSDNRKIKIKTKDKRDTDRVKVEEQNRAIEEEIEGELKKEKSSARKIKKLLNQKEYNSKTLKNAEIDTEQSVDSKEISSSQEIISKAHDSYNHDNKIDTEVRTGYQSSKRQYTTGYKEHIAVDEASGLILKNLTTFANTHDIDSIPIFTNAIENIDSLYADKAYKSATIDKHLKEQNIENNICLKEKSKMTKEEKEHQREKERPKHKIRAKVEHPFASIKTHMKQGTTRVVGLVRNHLNMTLTCIAFNLKRLAHQEMRLAKVTNR